MLYYMCFWFVREKKYRIVENLYLIFNLQKEDIDNKGIYYMLKDVMEVRDDDGK